MIHSDPFPSTTYVGPLHFVLARHMTSIDALIYVLVNARTWLGVPRPQDAHLRTARTKGPRALHTGLLTPLTLSPMAMRWHALSYPKGRGAQGVGVGVGGGGSTQDSERYHFSRSLQTILYLGIPGALSEAYGMRPKYSKTHISLTQPQETLSSLYRNRGSALRTRESPVRLAKPPIAAMVVSPTPRFGTAIARLKAL